MNNIDACFLSFCRGNKNGSERGEEKVYLERDLFADGFDPFLQILGRAQNSK